MASLVSISSPLCYNSQSTGELYFKDKKIYGPWMQLRSRAKASNQKVVGSKPAESVASFWRDVGSNEESSNFN